MAGRPITPGAVIRQRRDAWNRAVSFCGLKQVEIAEVIGMSVSTVMSYGSRSGNVPSQEAIDLLKRHNLIKAMDTLAERYGAESVTVGGPRP